MRFFEKISLAYNSSEVKSLVAKIVKENHNDLSIGHNKNNAILERGSSNKKIFLKSTMDQLDSLDWVEDNPNKSFTYVQVLPDAIQLWLQNFSLKEIEIFQKISFSLFIMKASIQFQIPRFFIPVIFDLFFDNLNENLKALNFEKEKELKFFGIKREGGEGLKTNIFFSDIFKSCKRVAPLVVRRFISLSGNCKGFSNDQATSSLLWAVSQSKKFGINSVDMAIKMIKQPNVCKSLNILIKSSGNNSDLFFSVLTESHCLQGMTDVEAVSLRDSVSRRVSKDFSGKVVHIEKNLLEDSIDFIIGSELDIGKYKYISTEDMWASRWMWSVNGSHNTNLEKNEKEWKIKTEERMYRKGALENIDFNGIDNFKGNVYVGSSFKKEIGKSGRTILSCDTQSYLAFSHLLIPVEKAWKNDRILLRPGDLGQAMMADKVRKMGKDGINVMLDYDEFDYQHTLENQSLVIERLCKMIDFPVDLSKKLVNSFFSQKLYCEGSVLGFMTHSLATGHRATTFINSVLNAAYIKSCMSLKDWFIIKSFHAGDDVVSLFPSISMLSEVLDKFKMFNLRMNPIKQSIGYLTKEFLRIAITDKYSVGYFCRSLGRCISGNWETQGVLDAEQKLILWISNCRSLINRSQYADFPDIFCSIMSRNTGVNKGQCRLLLSGRAGLGDGPIYYSSGLYVGYEVSEKIKTDPDELKIKRIKEKGYNDLATSDYLYYKSTTLERKIFRELGLSPKKYMLEASYAKNQCVKELTQQVKSLKLRKVRSKVILGYRFFDEVKKDKQERTLLDYNPLLSFVLKKIPVSYLLEESRKLGFSIRSVLEMTGNIKKQNFIEGVLSYSDASSIRATNTLIVVLHNSYV